MSTELRLDERPLSRPELTEAAWVASRAFFDDPFFVFLVPNDRVRAKSLMQFFRTTLTHLGPGGRLSCVRDAEHAIKGVAAWLPTGSYPQSIGTQLAQVPGSLRAFVRRPRSMINGNNYVATAAHHHPKDLHWYLYLLVADPSVQRRGVGTILMAPAIASIDDEGVGAYLETQKEENLAYYRRFGYELRETLRPVSDGPPLFTMWRDPR